DEGWYAPLTARQLVRKDETYSESTPTKAAAGEVGVMSQTNKRPVQTDRLQVEVAARPLSAWKEKDAATEPPFYLPASSSVIWLDRKDVQDLGATMALLDAKKVPLKTYAFDLGKDKGSMWAPENSMLTSALFIWGPWLLLFVLFLILMRHTRKQGGADVVVR